ncbi:Transposase IS200 like protein [Novipirellula galeiformis]|uniref:Transposase IS200 like protein n=2 Tax=Novipirellula galeiformis TaxID=2528004 RepID=A0A5C6CEI0_9BACT|nr:Transposase IS200 like protein [Novipirellula galeiformis]
MGHSRRFARRRSPTGRRSPGSGLVCGVVKRWDWLFVGVHLLLGGDSMPRPPRIQFPGANYHILTRVSRGDGRRKRFHDPRHYERFTQGLQDEVQRSGWIVLTYCLMPNQIHALIQTPEPNLASGMQHWLSGYAHWYAKRNQRTGHLYQGRYKAILARRRRLLLDSETLHSSESL